MQASIIKCGKRSFGHAGGGNGNVVIKNIIQGSSVAKKVYFITKKVYFINKVVFVGMITKASYKYFAAKYPKPGDVRTITSD